jgi:hypothetical protein
MVHEMNRYHEAIIMKGLSWSCFHEAIFIASLSAMVHEPDVHFGSRALWFMSTTVHEHYGS